MAETLENKFPQSSEDDQHEESNDIVNLQETVETKQETAPGEDQVDQANPETPETDPGLIKRADEEGVEAARQSLDAAFDQPDQTQKEPAADQEGTPQAEIEKAPENKYQDVINAAKQQLDQDLGIETVSTEETPEEVTEQAETTPEELEDTQQTTEAQQEIVTAAEGLERELESTEMTPEMKEYVEETQKRMEKELEGLDIPEEGAEKKERPRRGALKKAMLVITAAAALWMFQATVSPDSAEAKGKQTQIEKFEKKQKRRIAKETKKLQKLPEKVVQGVSKDVQKTLNNITKGFIKGIFN